MLHTYIPIRIGMIGLLWQRAAANSYTTIYFVRPLVRRNSLGLAPLDKTLCLCMRGSVCACVCGCMCVWTQPSHTLSPPFWWGQVLQLPEELLDVIIARRTSFGEVLLPSQYLQWTVKHSQTHTHTHSHIHKGKYVQVPTTCKQQHVHAIYTHLPVPEHTHVIVGFLWV